MPVTSMDQSRSGEHKTPFEEVFRRANDAIFLIDPVRDTIADVNPMACSLLGYSREQLLSMPVSRIHPAEMPLLLAFYESVSKHKLGWTDELNCITRSGQMLPAEISASVVDIEGSRYMLALVRDISARKAAEDALRKLSNAVEQAQDHVLITDQQGRIEYVNHAFEAVTGYAREEAIGNTPRLLKSGEQDAAFYEQMWASILAGKVYRGVVVNKKKNGDRFFDEKIITPLRDAQGRITHFVSTGRDITEQKRIEDERQQLIEDLEAFAHTVAHDLKAPLSVMTGFAGTIQEDLPDLIEQELRDRLSHIVQNAARMINIVDDLLLLASTRREAVSQHILNMAEIVDAARHRLAYMIAEKNAIVSLPSSWPPAWGYGPWVEEVWVNYISNAIKYGGQPPRIELGWRAQRSGQASFWVRDNGPGISLEEQARLFAPFVRLNQASTQGHGLGLSIVRRIVEKLGGEVGLESGHGEGSCFAFTLPLAVDARDDEILKPGLHQES